MANKINPIRDITYSDMYGEAHTDKFDVTLSSEVEDYALIVRRGDVSDEESADIYLNIKHYILNQYRGEDEDFTKGLDSTTVRNIINAWQLEAMSFLESLQSSSVSQGPSNRRERRKKAHTKS